jgi:hypothetical protein
MEALQDRERRVFARPPELLDQPAGIARQRFGTS